MKTLLHLQDLQKSFGQQLVLNHVGLELLSGEIIGLIGPSGAGKSTMIKTMLGMEKADSGIALVLDHTMPNRHILGDIGYMAQSDALYEALSGQENLEFFGHQKGLSKKYLKDEIAHVAQVVDLTDHLNKAVSGYSGGMKRRLSLAIALLGNPQLLILDEPTAGLDPKERVRLRELLADMAKDRIILVATHVVSDVETVATKVILLRAGKIVDAAPVPELIEKYAPGQGLEDVYLNVFGEGDGK